MEIEKFVYPDQMVDVGVPVDCQQNLFGSCVQQSLDFTSIVDATRTCEGLVAHYENRAIERMKLRLFEIIFFFMNLPRQGLKEMSPSHTSSAYH